MQIDTDKIAQQCIDAINDKIKNLNRKRARCACKFWSVSTTCTEVHPGITVK